MKEVRSYQKIEETLLGFKDSSISGYGKSRYQNSTLGMIGQKLKFDLLDHRKEVEKNAELSQAFFDERVFENPVTHIPGGITLASKKRIELKSRT